VRHVTIPLMSPVIFYSLVLGLVGVLQYFLVPLVLNSGTGRPAGTTYFFNIYIYNTFFSFGNMSYGATLAWTLFVVILASTLLLFWSARYWVYYAGEMK
jgi:multiple sugar transport system permease protein